MWSERPLPRLTPEHVFYNSLALPSVNSAWPSELLQSGFCISTSACVPRRTRARLTQSLVPIARSKPNSGRVNLPTCLETKLVKDLADKKAAAAKREEEQRVRKEAEGRR